MLGHLDHIGYIVEDIDATAYKFQLLGYVKEETIDDTIQKCHICFLRRENDISIELVKPFDDNKSMKRLQKKVGVAPYHICYVCNDIDVIYRKMTDEGWTALFKPVSAIAFEGRKICYFWCEEIGFIEFVNKK